MKKLASLLLVSILGGVLALGGYFYFSEEKGPVFMNENQVIPAYTPVTFTGGSGTDVDFTEAAKKTVHAVVHVKNMAVTRGSYLAKPGIYLRGTGSGVIISPDGYIVTNYHVIKDANQLKVTLNNNKSYSAEVIGADPKTDIALIKIDAEDLNYLPFGNSNNVEIGDWVLAVGNPFNLTSTVTAGIISATSRDLNRRDENYQSFIQTDAAINAGNSGGALVNTKGQLIGINTAISSQTGSYIGYSFAIPSNTVRKIVEDILEYGHVQEAILGVRGAIMNGAISKDLDLNVSEGFYIAGIDSDSGAKKAGLQKGDVILKIDNVKITKFADLTGYMNTKRPDDIVVVSYLRDGEKSTAKVKLIAYETYAISEIGLEVTNASEEELARCHAQNGVKISKALNPIMKAENLIGIIITEINQQKVTSVDDVRAAIQHANPRNPMAITFAAPNGEQKTFVFRGDRIFKPVQRNPGNFPSNF